MTLDSWEDAADNSARSYNAAVDAMRERLEKFRVERIGPHRLFLGDCREVMPLVGKVHAVVTDPPYHLTAPSGKSNLVRDDRDLKPTGRQSRNQFKTMAAGFMGQQWDGGDIAFRPETWELVSNALRPGGHLAAFSGSRTYHRMACAIEDAGFEVRDQLMWLYSQGFPKSLNVSKAINRSYRCKSTEEITEDAKKWDGWHSALKPSHEPICLARRPLSESSIAANVLEHSTGAINVDACRIPGEDTGVRKNNVSLGSASGGIYGSAGGFVSEGNELGRWPANMLWSYPEDEYELRPGVTSEQKRELYRWLSENS